MKRRRFCGAMKWLCILATAAGLILWIASGWFHVSTGWRGPYINGLETFHATHIDLNAGCIRVHRQVTWVETSDIFDVLWGRTPAQWALWGLWKHDGPGIDGDYILPIWPFMMITGLLGFSLWSAERRAALRRSDGRCLICGYDRRGLATPNAPCPECGAVPAPAAK